ncbi:MAG: JAB domain-containing protein [Roseburia sp.]|nr:JAB domain-containing protein [Roseburia sp.]
MGNLDRVAIRLVKEAEVMSSYPVTSPESAVRLVRDVVQDMDRECVCVLNLKSSMQPINFEIASIGTVNACLAAPRELMKSAILSNAANVIMMHNHPGGSIEPSERDLDITVRLYNAYEMMGITLLDHIIVGNGREEIYSFQNHGEIFLSDYDMEKYKYHSLVADSQARQNETERISREQIETAERMIQHEISKPR